MNVYMYSTSFTLMDDLSVLCCGDAVLLSMGRLHANFRNWGEAATSLTEAVKILGQSLGGHPITTEGSVCSI